MARVPLPIPGKDKDYDSRKSRAKLINLMVDVNQDGSFKSINKREGVEVHDTTTQNDAIVSNFHIGNDGRAYFCGTTNIYALSGTTLTDFGAHSMPLTTNSNVKVINNNAVPPQYFFNAGSGNAVILQGGVITAVTDVNFTGKNAIGGAHLLSRFYFNEGASDSDFFASEVLDGFSYDPLAFAAADEESGQLFDIRSYKSSLWMFKSRNIEYWQNFIDPIIPVRRVQGSSKRIGTFGPFTVDQLYEFIGFLGSDLKAYILSGADVQVVSDIDLSNMINQKGPGGTFSGEIRPFAYFVDGSNHRYLFITCSPIADQGESIFTWVYDLKTGQSHYRTTPDVPDPFWNYYFSAFLSSSGASDRTFLRNLFATPTIYSMSREVFDDQGVDFECLLQTGSISYDKDSAIEYIEVEMETGVGNAASTDPEMTVRYSKDGGVNFVTWGTVKLGGSTNKSNRIRMNNFGRLVRYTDFVLQLTITEPVRVVFYGAYAEITGGF